MVLPIINANAYICFFKTYGVLSTKISRIMPPPIPVSTPIDIEKTAISRTPELHAISVPVAEKVASPTASYCNQRTRNCKSNGTNEFHNKNYCGFIHILFNID